MTLQELLALALGLADATEPIDTEALTELEDGLRAAADERLDREGGPTDTDLAELADIASALEAVNTEADAREAAEQERADAAAALAERIRGEQADADATEDGDDGEPAEGTEPPADADTDQADAEPEPVQAAAAADADAEPEPAPATASAAPRIGRVAARRPAAVQPTQLGADRTLPDDIEAWGLVASANSGSDVTAGAPIRSRDQLAQAFMSAWQASQGHAGARTKVRIATAGGDPEQLYGEDRYLDGNIGANLRKIDDVTSPRALVASGGICAPRPVSYDLPVVGSTERNVRDELLVRFGADRGGVRVLPPPVLENLDGSTTVWTNANDLDPGSDGPATKPCLEITCPTEDEQLVAAIVTCLQTGNFKARFFQEQVEAWMRLAAVNQARVAETRLLAAMSTASTAATTGQLLSATRDILAAIDRSTAAIISRHRLSRNTVFRLGLPFWALNLMRTDLARELPGSSDERLAMAEASIEAMFAVRNIRVSWLLDGPSGQVFGVQGDGPVAGWPTTITSWLYPEGVHLFLDGGELDLGIVRDSTLNATNDLQIFAETFEGHVFHGAESWELTMDVCPDGATSATVDIDPCVSGS